MKKLLLIAIATLTMAKSYSQQYEIIGIDNSYKTDKSFSMGGDAIKKSIIMDLHNLNLYEYAHSLKELYELLATKQITHEVWINYIDEILSAIEKERVSSKRPYWGVDYMGIAPLQAEFFLSSLDLSDSLKNIYPQEYNFLKESTLKLKGKGYSSTEIDSLLVVIDKEDNNGTVNYWFLLQVFGCPIYELARQKEVSDALWLINKIEPESTYKVPAYLQERKLVCLEKKIKECCEGFEWDIWIFDDVDNYYDNSECNCDIDKLKEF